MFLALALAIAPQAQAYDEFADNTLRLEVVSQGMSQDALLSGGARLDMGAPYVSVEGRSQLSGHWVGRGSLGVDIFEDWEGFDLELGLSMSGGGDWYDRAVYAGPGVGFEFGMGVNVGRIHGHYRAITPFSDNPVGMVSMERRWRLGVDVFDRLQLFGQGTVVNETAGVTDWEKARAVGLGAALSF